MPTHHPMGSAGTCALARFSGLLNLKRLAERIRPSKSAIEGELTQVTGLFADLKSSTELPTDPRRRTRLSVRRSDGRILRLIQL